jgi:hypothetical protein
MNGINFAEMEALLELAQRSPLSIAERIFVGMMRVKVQTLKAASASEPTDAPVENNSVLPLDKPEA